eukprot:3016837-Rhodomonas_salina.1
MFDDRRGKERAREGGSEKEGSREQYIGQWEDWNMVENTKRVQRHKTFASRSPSALSGTSSPP